MPSKVNGAADLRDKVGFYKRTAAGDGYGNTQAGFPGTPEFPAVAANIAPRLGGEQVLADRLTGVNLVNITVRKSSSTATVEPDWRAKDERTAEVYNIRSIIDPNKGTSSQGRFLEMLCEKGVAT